MKKLALLFVCTLIFTSCDIDDDNTRIVPVYAEVTEADLPEFFEEGESYDIDITYVLPDVCHQAAGLDVNRGGQTGDARRDIYVAGIATFDANLAECNQEDDDLEVVETFTITIDEEEPYTFYLWQGIDVDNENVFTTIEVPVGEPDTPDPEE